jgi:hypothetical protein
MTYFLQHQSMSTRQQQHLMGAEQPHALYMPRLRLLLPTALSAAAMAAWAMHSSSSSSTRSKEERFWRGMPASHCTMRL